MGKCCRPALRLSYKPESIGIYVVDDCLLIFEAPQLAAIGIFTYYQFLMASPELIIKSIRIIVLVEFWDNDWVGILR